MLPSALSSVKLFNDYININELILLYDRSNYYSFVRYYNEDTFDIILFDIFIT